MLHLEIMLHIVVFVFAPVGVILVEVASALSLSSQLQRRLPSSRGIPLLPLLQ